MNIGVQLVAAFRDEERGDSTKVISEEFRPGDPPGIRHQVSGLYERRLIRGIDANGNAWRLIERCQLVESDMYRPIPLDRWKPVRWERETAANVPFCRPEVEG